MTTTLNLYIIDEVWRIDHNDIHSVMQVFAGDATVLVHDEQSTTRFTCEQRDGTRSEHTIRYQPIIEFVEAALRS